MEDETIGRVAWVEATTQGEAVTFGLGHERRTYILPSGTHAFEVLKTSLVNGQAVLIRTEDDGKTVCSVLLSHRTIHNRRKPRRSDLYVTFSTEAE